MAPVTYCKTRFAGIYGSAFADSSRNDKILISEQQSNAEKVRKEISKQWASKQVISGEFIIPDNNNEILWNEAYFTIGITDNRGLKGQVRLKEESVELEAEPGVRDQKIFTAECPE